MTPNELQRLVEPVGFSGVEYIRVGSYKKRLKDFPEKERALWTIFSEKPFESCLSAASVTPDEALALIDYASCFRLLGIPLPENHQAILDRLDSEKVIARRSGDRFDITNVGAVLFAADLRRFDRLARKAPRVIIYQGDNRTQTIKEHVEHRGYAAGFESLIAYINDFIDEPPRSRNEPLAGLMRRMNICEERGSGIDKVIASIEEFQLPAPDFRTTSQHTVAVLFGPREFSAMDRQDRIRACYQHACLWYVSNKQITNATLRGRLKITKTNYPLASRIIRDTIDAKLIRPFGGLGKESGYVPFWA